MRRSFCDTQQWMCICSVDPNSEDHSSGFPAALRRPTSETYEQAVARLRIARQEFHEEMARQYQLAMDEYLPSKSFDRYEQKRDFCRQVAEDMRAIGVAIRCPNTGLDAALTADASRRGSAGIFRLRATGSQSKLTFSSVRPFAMQIVPHYVRIEPFAHKWIHREDGPAGDAQQR